MPGGFPSGRFLRSFYRKELVIRGLHGMILSLIHIFWQRHVSSGRKAIFRMVVQCRNAWRLPRQSTGAVSYTHLDVYKRQPERKPGNGGCRSACGEVAAPETEADGKGDQGADGLSLIHI